jgi:purine-nucleoside phosphorylase
MNPAYEKLLKCYKACENKLPYNPKIGIVLGSGLGGFADSLSIDAEISYSEIEGFPVSTAPGHKGRFVFAKIDDIPIVIMQGRVHYYEGYAITDVVLPIRLMGLMGIEILLLTNASGSVNPQYLPGDFMLITDQISNFTPSPLVGANIDELGVRFPDMSNIYRGELQEAIRNAAGKLKVSLREGVYLQFTGPNFETPHEVKMAGILGADAVGMSTACEALAANHMGIKVAGISCISNLGCGLSDKPLSSEDVNEMAALSGPKFEKLVIQTIKEFGELL